MIPIIDGVIALATEVFKFLNIKESRKYIQQLQDIRMTILHEEEKGYEADDAMIEQKMAELKIVMDSIRADIATQQKGPTGA